MTAALDGAVELLERSLAYTRGTLAGVRPELLDRPTPCSRWLLGDLLAHMEDALDAFTEAAAGHVVVDPVPPTGARVEALRDKACALLGAWAAARPAAPSAAVRVGDADLAAPLLVATAALEITVHGWDVAQATGARTPIPADLARGLLPVAHAVVSPADHRRFAPPRSVTHDTPPADRLLAWTGRAAQMTRQPDPNHREPTSRAGVGS